MRSISLLALRDSVRWRADIVGDTARHADANLTSEINAAIVELRGRLTRDGAELYLASDTGTLTTVAAAAGENYVSITAPATAERIEGIDIVDDGNLIRLEHVAVKQRHAFGADTNDGQYPGGWGLLDLDTREIAIYPIPNEAYSYVLWYQTQHTDLSADGDTITELPGFADFIIWTAVAAVAVRDDLGALKSDAAVMADRAYQTALQSALDVAKPDNWRKPTRHGRGRLTAAGRYRSR